MYLQYLIGVSQKNEIRILCREYDKTNLMLKLISENDLKIIETGFQTFHLSNKTLSDLDIDFKIEEGISPDIQNLDFSIWLQSKISEYQNKKVSYFDFLRLKSEFEKFQHKICSKLIIQ